LKRMSDHAKGSSEKLLYDLIHLTVKGNGVSLFLFVILTPFIYFVILLYKIDF
jgi:hypothetical protein